MEVRTPAGPPRLFALHVLMCSEGCKKEKSPLSCPDAVTPVLMLPSCLSAGFGREVTHLPAAASCSCMRGSNLHPSSMASQASRKTPAAAACFPPAHSQSCCRCRLHSGQAFDQDCCCATILLLLLHLSVATPYIFSFCPHSSTSSPGCLVHPVLHTWH